MKRILCTIPTATSPINGIEFGPHERGLISASVEEEEAEYFATIPGYELLDAGVSAPVPVVPVEPVETVEPDPAPAPAEQPVEPAAPAPAEDPALSADAPAADEPTDERTALRAELAALGGTVNNKWGVDRLKAEINAARQAGAQG